MCLRTYTLEHVRTEVPMCMFTYKDDVVNAQVCEGMRETHEFPSSESQKHEHAYTNHVT